MVYRDGKPHPRRPRSGSGRVDIGPADEGIVIVNAIDAQRAAALYLHSWSVNDQSNQVAQHLEEMDAAKRRGFSPACARDVYQFRQRVLPKAIRLFTPMLGDSGMGFVTIFQQGWFFAEGELHRADGVAIVQKFKQELRDIMQRCGYRDEGLLIGMLEVGLRYNKDGSFAGFQLHVHAVADAAMMRVVWKLSRAQFGERAAYMKQPILRSKLPTLERLQSRLGYSLKAQPRGMVLGGRVSQSTGDSGPTTQHELDAPAVIEPLLWLDRMAFSELFIVFGTYDLRAIGRMRRRPQI